MNNTNSSLYFDAVERFMYTTSHNCSIAVLNNIAENNGCAENLVDQVINGVVVDFVMNLIASSNKSNKFTDAKENEVSDYRINPTYKKLMDILTKEKFSDLSIGRAEKIIGYLVQKTVLTIDDNGTLYKSKSLLPHQLVQLL